MALTGGTATTSFVPTAPVVGSNSYFVEAVDPVSGCVSTRIEVILTVNPTPTAADATLIVCDEDANGFAMFTLTDADSDVLAGQIGMTVSYHALMSEAEAPSNPLTSPYMNALANLQQIFVRVESADGCFAVGTVDLVVDPLTVITISITETSGNTDDDGEICEGDPATLTVDQGGLAYLWSGGEFTQAITPTLALITTTYTVTVTGLNGCTSTMESTITVNPLPTSTVVFTETSGTTVDDGIICNGDDVTLTVVEVGVSYLWSEGASTAQLITVSPAVDTDYSVTVTDLSGCASSAMVTVVVNQLPIPTIVGSTTFCTGNCTTLDAGVFDSYLWSDGMTTTQTLEVCVAGDYTVTITDANGCEGTATITITESSSLNPVIAGSTSFCTGSSTTLDAGIFNSYVWNDGTMLATLEVSVAGTYTVTVSDASGCTGTDEVVVTENTNLTPTITGNDSFCAGDCTTLDAGTFDSYLWSDVLMTTTQTLEVCVAGDYIVTVTDATGCTGTDMITITENPLPVPVITGAADICVGDCVTLDAGLFDAYLWSSGEVTQTLEVCAAGDYTVIVTDINGCTGTATVTIDENPLPVVDITGDANICTGECTDLDAGVFDTYAWSTLETTQIINVCAGGTYTVTVTDANGCTGTDEIIIIENPLPVPVISGSTSFCIGSCTTLDAGIFDAYLWSDVAATTTPTLEVCVAGDFTVTVTDANGCTGTAIVTVIESTSLNPVITGDTEICVGDCTTLDAGIFDSYLWSSTETTQTITVCAAGTYTVEVTDASGCTGTGEIIIIENSLPVPVITGSTTFCIGNCTTLDAGVFDSYIWSDGFTSTATFTACVAGDYTVTVTDANGCEGTATVNITESSSLNPTITGNDSFCAGDCTDLDAGVFDSYIWSTLETTQIINVCVAGTYTVTVSDASGCTGTDEITVTEDPLPVPIITGSLTFCVGSCTILDAGPFNTYTWSDGITTTQTITVCVAGDYTVTVTDANGCEGTATVTVTESPVVIPVITGDLSFCTGDCTVLDAGVFDSYQWNDGATTTTQTLTVCIVGDYFVTVTDANGCTGTAMVTVTEDPLPVPVISGSTTFCIGSCTILDAGVFDAYEWSDGTTIATFSACVAGTYTVIVTDVNGCTGTAEIDVTEAASLSPTITGNDNFCTGDCTVLDAGIFDTYQWSQAGESTSTITVCAPGNYTVIVTDAAGCTGTDLITITENPLPVPVITGSTTFCAGICTTLDAGVFDSYVWNDGAGTITSTLEVCVAGTFIVTVTDGNGCTGTASVTVTESTSLSPVIGGDLSFCTGDCTVLDAGIFDAYEWSPGTENTQTITVCVAGTYTVLVSDVSGCTGTAEVLVIENPLPIPVITGNTTICTGDCTDLDAGIFDAYTWSTGDITQITNVCIGGTYTVTVTDANGCTGTAEIDVIENPLPVPVITGDLSFCTGDCTVLDAGIFISYEWSDGVTITQTFDACVAGDFTVTVTDINGCTGTVAVTVTEDPLPVPVITGNDMICAGDCTTLDAGVFGTYEWSTLETTQTVDVCVGGTFTVTVTDGNGCTGTAEFIVIENPLPISVITGIDFCTGDCTDLDAGVFDAYVWSTLETTQIINVCAGGTYTVTVTDANGCTSTDEIIIIENPLPVPIITGNDNFCTNDCTIVDAGLFNSYAWSDGVTTTQTATICVAGTFTVTVTDGNGCTGTAEIVITENPLPVPVITGTDICAGSCTDLDAGLFDAYQWSTGGIIQLENVCADGTYTVTVTDANGCTGTAEFTVIENPLPIVNIIGNDICVGDCTDLDAGVFDAYLWSTAETTPIINVCAGGTYTVTVTDANGCTNTDEIDVIENPLPVPVITGGTEFCPGECIDLDAGIFDTYLWSDASIMQTLNVCVAGTYTVEVTDANGCVGTASVIVTEGVPPTPIIVITETSGTTNDDGIICTGDCADLDAGVFDSYLWNDASIGQILNVCIGGTYTVTVTDANGCTATAEAIIIENPLPLPTITVTETSGTTNDDSVICTGDCADLDAGLFVSYSWSTGETTQLINVCAGGTYTVTVTDANGCENTTTVTIIENPLPLPIITGSDEICTGSCTDLNAGVFDSYLWSDAAATTTQILNVCVAGTYTVTVTDGNGCENTAEITVTENPLPIPVITGNDMICTGDCTTLDAGAFDFFQWDGGQTTQTIDVCAAGTYTVTVTDTNGCTATAEITVTENPLPTPTITGNDTFCADDCTALGVGAVFTDYTWSTGETTATITVCVGGTIGLTVTDANGCIGSTSIDLIQNPLPPVIITGVTNICIGEMTTLTASAGFVGYVWTPNGEPTQSISVTTPGIYTVAVTDTNGCVGTSSVIVTNSSVSLEANITSEVLDIVGNDTTTYHVTCNGGSDGSAIVVPQSGQAPFTYQWSDFNNTATPEVDGLSAGTYTVTVIDDLGCSGTATVTLDDPTPVIVDAFTIDPTCYGEYDGSIVVNSVLGGIGTDSSFTYSIDGSTYFQADTIFNFLPSGTYTLIAQDSMGCTDEIDLVIAEQEEPFVNLGPDVQIDLGDSIQIIGTTNLQIDSLIWDPVTPDMSCNDCLVTWVQPEVDIIYNVTVLDGNGCSASDDILIEVLANRDVYIPNTFTPDDSGYNDLFTVYGSGQVSNVLEMKVFDRWGELIYDAPAGFPVNEPGYGWDGYFKGKKMNPAVFIYYIQVQFIDGQVKEYKGDVTLVR
jgi:gliding motility-associated-like protein